MIFIDEKDPIDSLALMCCLNGSAIIANSTFSWWGAMLGIGLRGKSVVYPLNWMKDKLCNSTHTPDLFPSTWKGM